jgi:anion-transporting  ArsA/GET3 family ATPase
MYQNITGKFVQSHDYIAMERLYEIHSSGRYDLIVVDTPPTRNAIDFLEAPERMADFFGSRLLKWLTAPYRSRVVNLASKPFYTMADRILGAQFLEDIAEFFLLFQTMYSGFVERSRAVARLLADHGTTFIVVSTLEPAPAQEAEFFVQALSERKLGLGALVFNKVLPADLFTSEAAAVADRLCRDPEPVAAAVADRVADSEQVARVLNEVGESFLNYRLVAARQAEEAARLSAGTDVCASVPFLEGDVHDLRGLVALGEHVWS